MGSLDKKQYFLDVAGLISIGLISLGYVLFSSKFAEQHIQFSFLNFPIFVGEILLFVCALLFVAKYYGNPTKLTKWHYAIIVYFVFVVIKALYGYVKWGPLAFRHAALFYYPAFAVFSYAFYRREFLSGKIICFLVFLIVSTFIYGRFYGYFVLTLVSLGIILIKSYPRRWVKISMFLALLVFTPYQEFFYTSRMMVVSNFASGIYLASRLPFVLKGKKETKFMIVAVIIGAVLLGLFKSADRNALKSIVDFKRMVKVINECDVEIAVRASNYKVESRREVKLFNPEKAINSTIGEKEKEEERDFSSEQVKKEIRRLLTDADKKENMRVAIEKVINEEKSLIFVEPAQAKKMMPEIFIEEEAREVFAEPAQIKKGRLETLIDEEIQKAFAEQALEGGKEMSVDQINKAISVVFANEVKEDVLLALEKGSGEEETAVSVKSQVDGSSYYNDNAVFRILIWRDMLRELLKKRPIFGFDFGRPLRSRSLEIIHWGDGDWARDGWIAAHNSHLHIIYRAGIFGVAVVFGFLTILFCMIKKFITVKSLTGILFCGIIVNWFVAANFLLTFELPYTAIPIWTLFGLTYAHCYKKEV